MKGLNRQRGKEKTCRVEKASEAETWCSSACPSPCVAPQILQGLTTTSPCGGQKHRSMRTACRWCIGLALDFIQGWILLWLPRATREWGIMNRLALNSLKSMKVSCETVINVMKMIMFISMYLLRITQLVTVQQLLMFHFWAAGQIRCSTSDMSLIRYQH